MNRFCSLKQRFSDHALEIRRLLRDDESFREICEDYETAVGALAYWRKVDRRSDERAKDYLDLIAELETEIMTTLATARR